MFKSGLGSDLGAGFFCSVLPITDSDFGNSREVSSGAGSGAETAFSKFGVCAESTCDTGCRGIGRLSTGGSGLAIDWIMAAKDARRPLGAVKSRRPREWRYSTTIAGAPDGHYAMIQFDTRFEGKADAVETLTVMRDFDGLWRVAGYFVK